MPRQIGRQAPYLRRYARALTGGQAAGDDLVQLTLERLLAKDIVLDESAPVRPALYAALHAVWRAGFDGQSESVERFGASGLTADHRLQTLTPEQRAALLLCAMEGFSPAEAAYILGADLPGFAEMATGAEAAVRRQLATDVLIIEDEPIIGLDLTRLTRELGHRVVGVAATRTEAVAMAVKHRPGLVLADVQLADGSSGLDAAADILKIFDIPTIFITAFPEHLLTGDRPEPAFLITKPFREDAVQALIGQALFFHQPQPMQAQA